MDNIMQRQERVQKILQHDTRVATDLKNRDQNVSLDEDFYAVEATKSENAFIDDVLNTQKYMGEIQDSDRIYLENVHSRNDSHILVNDHKWYGDDSGLMGDVKRTITELEKSLKETDIDRQTIAETREKYKNAITACENYIAGKNPWFPAGKRRKKEVEERLKTLREEQQRFEWGVSGVDKNLMDGVQPGEMMSYLTLGHQQMNAAEEYGKRYKKHFEEQFDFGHAVASMYVIKNKDDEFDVKDKKLSPQAQEFFDKFFKSRDVVEALMTNEVNDRWAGFEGLKDKNMYMNEALGLQVENAYKLLQSNNDNYFPNNAVLDELFEKYEHECRASDVLSFVIALMSTEKSKIEDPDVYREVSEKLDYYYEISDRLQKFASRHLKVMEKIMKGKPLEPKDIENSDMEDNLTLRGKAGM